MKIFCERLKELRIERQISKLQLAKEIGYSDAAISRWESEKRIPNIEELAKIAKFFDVSTDFLLGLSDYWFLILIISLFKIKTKIVILSLLIC